MDTLPDEILQNILQRIGCDPPLPQTRVPGQNPSRYLWRHLHQVPSGRAQRLAVTTTVLSALVCKRWRALADAAVSEVAFSNHDASRDFCDGAWRFSNLTSLRFHNVFFPDPSFPRDLAKTTPGLSSLELSNCRCKNGDSFVSFLEISLPSWGALRRLALGRVLCGVEHVIVLKLLHRVCTVASLEDFSFFLDNCDDILAEVGEAVGGMSHLRSLSLGVQDLWHGLYATRLTSLINCSIEDASPGIEDSVDIGEWEEALGVLPLESLRIANTCMDFDNYCLMKLKALPRLRVLTLEDVGYWKDGLPEHIDKLAALEELNLRSLYFLEDGEDRLLPETIGKMNRLRVLRLIDCAGVQSLPKSLGCLDGLRELWLDGCVSITELAESIGGMTSLQVLRLRGCHSLVSIPRSISKLVSLRELHLSGGVSYATLSEVLRSLCELRALALVQCLDLEALPESMGRLRKLQELSVEHCPALGALPESLGQLAGLRVLQVHRCSALQRLPSSLANLERLSKVEIADCVSLCEVPQALLQSRSFKLVH